MEYSKTVEISGVGLVLFERSKRARRISISIKPFQGIRVTVPYASSFKEAEEFVCTKKTWIKKNLENMKRYERIYNNNSVNADCLDKVKAKTTLVKRLKWLAAKYGFSYKKVFIRNQKTIWGSCSGKNNISLNVKLVQLPDELVDYVILHELVHTIKKDHSKAFWAEMDKLVGDGKKMSKRLKNYGMKLY